MPNQFTSQLLQSSFRGVPFAIRDESITEAGNKLVLHEYPNSNVRHVENLGQIPPKFRIDAFVFGNNWKRDAANLQRALEDATAGRLVLPVLGAFTVYALPYSLLSTQQRLGVIGFQLAFVSGVAETGQPVAQDTTESVLDAADTAREAIQEEFAGKWKIPKFSLNSLVATYDITSLVDKVSMQVSSVVETTDEIITQAESIKRDVFVLSRDSEALAGALFAISRTPASFFQGIANSLTRTVTNIGNIFTLVGFGSELSTSLTYIATKPQTPLIDDLTPNADIALWQENTAERIKRNDNRRLIVNACRIASLILAYEQTAASEYLTKQEVQEIRKQLEDIYNTIVLASCIECNYLQTFENVRRTLEIVRNRALSVLAIKEQQSYNIETRERIEPISSIALAYKLYAEDVPSGRLLLDRASLIRNLNLDKPALQLSGDVQIFTREGD